MSLHATTVYGASCSWTLIEYEPVARSARVAETVRTRLAAREVAQLVDDGSELCVEVLEFPVFRTGHVVNVRVLEIAVELLRRRYLELDVECLPRRLQRRRSGLAIRSLR